ncbi:DUF5318 family protein [Corynebacterium sp. 319]
MGELRRRDICDAKPHLLHSADVLGDAVAGACPVCGRHRLRMIRWIHGVVLGEKSGTARNVREIRSVVDTFLDDADASADSQEMSIHTVEVCLGCKWNYLLAEDILRVQQ